MTISDSAFWIGQKTLLKEAESKYFHVLPVYSFPLKLVAEIEAVVADHPFVLESAVVGCPDEILGEITVCFIVKKKLGVNDQQYSSDDAAGNSIKEFCSLRLTQSKVPLKHFFVTHKFTDSRPHHFHRYVTAKCFEKSCKDFIASNSTRQYDAL